MYVDSDCMPFILTSARAQNAPPYKLNPLPEQPASLKPKQPTINALLIINVFLPTSLHPDLNWMRFPIQ